MVRFNDKAQIANASLTTNDIIPITDLDDSTNDKKVTIGQLNTFFGNNITTFATKDLANTGMLADAIISAPNGVIVAGSGNTSIIVKNGLKILFSNGRTSDKRFNVTSYTVGSDISQNIATLADDTYELFINSSGTIVYTPLDTVHISRNTPTLTENVGYWYDVITNYWKYTSNKGTTWSNVTINALGQFTVASGVLTDVTPNTVAYIPNPEALMVRDLSNITDSGEDKVHELVERYIELQTPDKVNQSKAWETGAVSSDVDAYEDILNYRYSSFGHNVGANVYGDRTINITDDGIASGFSSSNFLYPTNFRTLSLLKDKSWTIISPIFSDITTAEGKFFIVHLCSSGYGADGTIYFTPSTMQLWFTINTVDDTTPASRVNHRLSVGVTLAKIPDKLQTKFSFDINTGIYSCYYNIFDGNGWQSAGIMSPTTSNKQLYDIYNLTSPIRMGYKDTNTAGTAKMDLKYASIIVDGQEVFSGNKTGLDVIKPDNYSIVGSPTITDDGVASGFSAYNHISSILTTNIKSKLTVRARCIFDSSNTLSQVIFRLFNTAICRIIVKYDGFNFWCNNTFSSLSKSMSNGDVVDIEAIYEVNKQTYYISINGISTKVTGTVTCSIDDLNTTSLIFGQYATNDTNNIMAGLIDLNAFKIYSDDQLVYQPCLKIPYTWSKTGSKIVDVNARNRVQDFYEQYGYAPYYTIDEENENFTLPMGEVYGIEATGDLSNITNEGNNKLITSNYYENTGDIIYNDEKGYNNIIDYKYSTFDNDKVDTTIGSPVIYNGLLLSPDASNYIKTPTLSFGDNPFRIDFKFSVGSSLTNGWVYRTDTGGDTNLCLWITSTAWSFHCGGTTGVIGLTYDNLNKDFEGYFIKYSLTEFEIYVKDVTTNTILLNDRIVKTTALSAWVDSKLMLGTIYSSGTTTGTGLKNIDLKHFSITSNGKPVFNFNKNNIDQIKANSYTVVGSPTIANDGIVSGFSGSNYLKVNKNQTLTASDNFEIRTVFTTKSATSTIQRFIWAYTWAFCVNINVDTGKFTLHMFGSETSSSDVNIEPIIANTTYEFITIVKDGIAYGKYKKIGDSAYKTTATLDISAKTSQLNLSNITIGRKSDDANLYFDGSVDLNLFQIYVDDQLVYQPTLRIPYNQTKTGLKIVDSYYRDRVIDMKEQYGHANYFTIDEENKNFTLPIGENLDGHVATLDWYKNGKTSWQYDTNLDCVETGACTSGTAVTLPKAFADTNYSLSVPYSSKTATGFTPSASGEYIAKGKITLG